QKASIDGLPDATRIIYPEVGLPGPDRVVTVGILLAHPHGTVTFTPLTQRPLIAVTETSSVVLLTISDVPPLARVMIFVVSFSVRTRLPLLTEASRSSGST